MSTVSGLKTSMPKLYNSWRGMRERCRNPNHIGSKSYYEKGISICKEWDCVVAFKEWAMENGYEEGLTIERINIDFGYSPENCKWIDKKLQARNTSRNRFIEHAGERLCVGEWAERIGVSSSIIRARIDRLGWSVSDALTIGIGIIPTGPKRKTA